MILKNKITFIVLACAVFFILPNTTNAQTTNSFTIDALVGGDVDAPTIPGNLTTTPITSAQIDLDWDASSDNVSVAGYQVFRDAAQIATTTLTSYSDTGLSSSTLYSYYVIAFDAIPNYSSSTPTVSTTTLAIVAPPPPEATSTIVTNTRLKDIEITFLDYVPSQNSIDLTFYTNVHARAVISWGRTIDYEGGFIASNIYKRNHNTLIDGLEAGTIYDIEIVLTNITGQKQLVRTISVETASGPDIIPPPNVSNLSSHLLGSGVRLSWTNPSVADFSHVRVLSSDYFYPTHIADGWLVYDGEGELVFDERPVAEDSRRYYTVFAYDDAGNTSSGAVTFITRGTYTPPPLTSSPGTDGDESTSTTFSNIPPIFSFDDVVFEQEGREKSSFGGAVTLEGDKNTTISIPYELLPERLKTVVVALQHPEDSEKVFSFLLRINPQKTSYEAKIAPLDDAGRYVTNVELFDFSTRELFSVSGVIRVVRTTLDIIRSASDGIGITPLLQKFGLPIWILLILIFAALILFILRRRKSEDRSL